MKINVTNWGDYWPQKIDRTTIEYYLEKIGIRYWPQHIWPHLKIYEVTNKQTFFLAVIKHGISYDILVED